MLETRKGCCIWHALSLKWWDNAPPTVRVQDGHITVRVTPSQAVSDLLVEALGPGKD